MIRVEVRISGEIEGDMGRMGYDIVKLRRELKENFVGRSFVHIKATHETCDSCGEWVDRKEDPIFSKHNSICAAR